MPTAPSIFLTAAARARLRQLLADGQPTARAIHARAHEILAAGAGTADSQDMRVERFIEAAAIVHLLDHDLDAARRGLEALLALTAPWTAGQLGLGHWGLIAAVFADACDDALSTAQRIALAQLCYKLCEGQKAVEEHVGNPHAVTNNHWAVSHSGAFLAALAAHGKPADASGRIFDLSEQIVWARARIKPFLMHHGDAGLYHEGLGYMMYPASFWMPAILASRNYDGLDLVEVFPQLRNVAASLYSSACARPLVPDDAGANPNPDGYGMKLSWNDDGPGWGQANVASIAIALAHPHQRGALRWMYDRLSGLESPGRPFAPGFCGLFFSLACYPYDVDARDPDGVLPTHVCDSRQGLAIFRNHYRDGDDAILGAYARATFVGGHAQDDGGSLRLMALGHDWITGGGQARGKAQWQSVVMPADGSRAKDPLGLGAVICDEPTPDGGVFAMDLRKVNVGYCERWTSVDYSGKSGSPVVLGLLDQIDDHLTRDWLWTLTFEAGLEFEADADRGGFTLRAADGANMVARFLGARPTSLELCHMPDSKRTYQGGYTRTYPGRPFIQATFANQKFLTIYTVMAVQRGPSPTIATTTGLGVRVGKMEWPRPFGPHIPEAFVPNRSGGMSRYPSGIPGYKVHP